MMARQSSFTKTKRVAQNTVFLFLRLMVSVGTGLFTSRVILQALGVEDFGIYNIVGTVVLLASFFKEALTNSTSRQLTFELGLGNEAEARRVFAMSLCLYALLSLIVLLVAETAGAWFLNTHLNINPNRMWAANWVYRFAIATFVLDLLKTPYNSVIVAHERMGFLAYVGIGEALLKLFFAYVLLWSDCDRLALHGFLWLLASLLVLVVFAAYSRIRFVEVRHRLLWNAPMARSLFSYSGWAMVVNAADTLLVQFNNLLFNWYGGVVANAAMGVTSQVNSQLNKLVYTFSYSFNPQIIKSYAQREYSYFMKLLFSTSRLSYFLLFAAAFPLMINLEYVLQVWLVTPPPLTATFLRLVILYTLIDAFSAPLWLAVYATGKLRTHQIIIASLKVMNMPLSFYALKIGLPLYTPLAIWAAINMVCAVARAVYMQRLIHLSLRRYFVEVMGVVLTVTALSVPLPLWYSQHHADGFTTLLVSSTLFIIPYGCLVYRMGMTAKERALLREICNFYRKER